MLLNDLDDIELKKNMIIYTFHHSTNIIKSLKQFLSIWIGGFLH